MSEQTNHPLDDVDLHAYVDGELSAEETANLDARLKEDAVLAESVAEIREMKALLQGAFSEESVAPPENLVSLVENDAKPKAGVQ